MAKCKWYTRVISIVAPFEWGVTGQLLEAQSMALDHVNEAMLIKTKGDEGLGWLVGRCIQFCGGVV